MFSKINVRTTATNLAPITLDSCAKGVIVILSTAQVAAVPSVRLADLAGTRT